MQDIRFYQSLWATEQRHPTLSELPVPDRFDMVKQDGWHGMAIDLGALPIEEARACVPEFGRTGLAGLLTSFVRTTADLRPALHLAKDIGSPFVVIVGQVMPVKLEDMVEVIRTWLAISAEEGVPIQFETHRNCITNDLYTMLQLIEIIPEMRIAADLSHYVVDREMMQPITPEYQAMMRKVLDRSDSFQGRVGTRNQVQVPIAFPQHKVWLDTFLDWWRYGLSEWKARSGADDSVIFLSELGPREYAMTGADGLELSDRRQEALKIRELVSGIWESL